MPALALVVRGRFQAVPSLVATRVAANVWSIRVPKTDPIHRAARRAPTAEAWDGAIFSIDGVEAEPAVGSGEDADAVVVTALVL